MYVYNAGIIDFFHGMVPLRDYILLMEKYKNDAIEIENFYLVQKELQNFLIKAFMSVHVYGKIWQGDISGDSIAISAIPIFGEIKPHRLLAFKQKDTGISFIASEHYLSGYETAQCTKMNDHLDIMAAFDKALDLSIKLLDKYAPKEIEVVRPKLVPPNRFEETLDEARRFHHEPYLENKVEPIPEGTKLDFSDFMLV